MTTTRQDFRDGDVVDYQPDPTRFDPSWCREGVAVVMASGDGRLDFVDNYWDGASEAHLLTDAEIETATLRFYLDDYRLHDRAETYSWQDYAPADRQMITSQHGLQHRLYVRKGATPDLDTRIANARGAVEDAEAAVAAEKRKLERARRELIALLNERVELTTQPTQ